MNVWQKFLLAVCLCIASSSARAACVPNAGYPWPLNGCLTASALNSEFATVLSKIPATAVLPGCVGDGITDDTTCVQAALNNNQGKVLWLGPFLYSVNALTTGSITIEAVRSPTGGIYNRNCTYGFKARSTTENLLTLTGDNTLVENLCIQMASGVDVQTAGAAITVGAVTKTVLRDGQINYPYVGIDISGNGGLQNNTNLIDNYTITDPSSTGAQSGIGIQIGRLSTGENTVDLHINNVIIDCVNFSSGAPRGSTIGMYFNDAGGAFVTNNDIYGCGIGTWLVPILANQQVNNNTFFSTVLGDTSLASDFVIDTTVASNAVGLGNVFQGTWTASSGNQDMLIKNTGGGSVTGNHFIGHRSYPKANQIALQLDAGLDMTFSDSMFCPQGGTSGNLITVANAVQNSSFNDNRIGSCDGFGGTTAVGMSIGASAGLTHLRGNTFINTTTPHSGGTPVDSTGNVACANTSCSTAP